MRTDWLMIAASASLLSASPAFAQSDLSDRYERWESQLRARVNSLQFYPTAAAGAAGDVLVAFAIGADGKPTGIAVQKTSGQPIFDRAAVQLVSRLGRIGPVPSAGGRVKQVVLKLSYGDPSSTAAESMRLDKADADERLANQRRNLGIISNSTQLAQKR